LCRVVKPFNDYHFDTEQAKEEIAKDEKEKELIKERPAEIKKDELMLGARNPAELQQITSTVDNLV